jgi:uncharacterized protein
MVNETIPVKKGRTMRFLALSLGLLAASPALAQETTPITVPMPVPMIVVSAEGRVATVPDIATVSAGVTTEGTTAAEALTANTEQMQKVMDLLVGAGIESGDMQTSNLNISPIWDNSKFNSLGQPAISGYQATNMLTVQVRDLDKLGGVLDQVVSNGANQLNGLMFGLSEPDPAMDEARQLAVAEALRRAKLLASASGVTVGPILSITEGGGYSDPQPMFRRMAAENAPVPVAAGEVGTVATVTITFAIVN